MESMIKGDEFSTNFNEILVTKAKKLRP